LHKCRERGAYADCYVVEVDGSVSQSAFIETFYTTPLFKVERALLKWFVARPSSDADARLLAEGSIHSFAAWRVEERTENQLLLADVTGRTKSWLMAQPVESSGSSKRTRLYFGSAVVPKVSSGGEARRLGITFHALLGFHRLYSRLLLSAARSRVLHGQR
jgi:hypothetical protein